MGRWEPALERSVVVCAIRRTLVLLDGDEARDHRVTETLQSAVCTSATVRSVRTLRRWGCDAAVYRWLTDDPERDTATIDLRESYTGGLLTRIPTEAFRASATVEAVRTTRERALANLIRSGAVFLTSALFATAAVTGAASLVGLGVLSFAFLVITEPGDFDTEACLDESSVIQSSKAVFAPADVPDEEQRP